MCININRASEDLPDFWKFSADTRTWTLLKDVGTPGFDAPSARSSHVMVAVDTDLFLHGGDDGILWRFSVEKMSWTKFDAGTPGKDAPSAQTGHAMCSDPEGRDLFLMGKSHLVLGGGKSPFVDGVGMLYLVLTS